MKRRPTSAQLFISLKLISLGLTVASGALLHLLLSDRDNVDLERVELEN